MDQSSTSLAATLEPCGNIFMRITSRNQGVIDELRDAFTFEIENARYHPLVKARKWDGKIRLIRENSVTYTGLAPEIQAFAHERGITLTSNLGGVDPATCHEVDMPKLQGIFQDVVQAFGHKPYRHQVEAILAAIRNPRMTMVSPTASGKSLILYVLTRYFDQCTILIVPTTNLVLQMENDFISYGMDAAAIHTIMSGRSHEAPPSTKVVITTWQSLLHEKRDFFEQFNVLMCDEVHGAKAKSLVRIAESCVNCNVRIGTTGSLDNIKSNRLTIVGLFGPIHRVVTTADLTERGLVTPLKVHLVKFNYTMQDRTAYHNYVNKHYNGLNRTETAGKRYHDEIDFLINHGGRREVIANLVAGLPGNTMVLFSRVAKDGQKLYDYFKEHWPDREVYFVHGGTDAEQRDEIRGIVESGDHVIVIASVAVFSTGVNVKRLHNAVAIAPTKSIIRTLQSIGRTLRLASDKSAAHWYDIIDDLTYNKKPNYSLKHAAERVIIYRHEGFEMIETTVDIR